MSLKRNFSVGFIVSIWGALLGLAAVPFYLKYLGTEAYGLIGFFATTQALLQLLDLGLSPTINREVARCSASGNMREARNLLHTMAIVYWIMAGLIALVAIGLAPFVAEHWLKASQLPVDTVTHAITLMGVVVACRWPVGLYMGALMGMQRVALSSSIGAVVGTLSSLGAIAILVFVSPTIEAFFIWQACVGFMYAIVMRGVAWKIMGEDNESRRFNIDDLKRIWRFSAGMSAVTLTGVILMQLDKVLLSKFLSLDDFGRYVLAGVVANGLYIFLTPLFNAIYPRMTALVASGETEKLIDLYKTGTRLFLTLFFPVVIMAVLFSEDFLFVWTRNQQLATSSALITSVLLLGTALNGVMHFPYALQLAYGSTRLPLTINVVLIIIMAPMIVVLSMSYGAIGGAMTWLLLNISYLIFGTWITHKNILKGEALDWLIHSVGIPFGISFIVMMAGWQFTYVKGSHYFNFLWGTSFILLALLANMLLMPKKIVAKIKQWRP
ncbi:lipopolysaccharide biosynthesis protein [Herminiimonas fonticola]|uniref:O-antigen/teichoic acid export membrane protein n=1 Tax=Herminiimonas fonticola TaxID=303380 RepID=A0A4R6G636_9BURK|nr:oligosaccharide flippase family protein [Herminiimonas fonticola]RBA24011.1 Polysaccharide biosynthesis protein [Herminiimonas fonticola]TDN90011.1 O-antigen/teichoic acid export membrane protein [Herminiimonas fonticola]